MLYSIKQMMLLFTLVYLLMPSYQSLAKDNGPDLLVSTEWLSTHIDDPSLVILHVGKKETYQERHISGAYIFSLKNIIEDELNGLSHEMPAIEKLHKALYSLGINDDSKIVIYYDSDRAIPSASRVFLTMEYLGFRGKTFLMNGGLQKWLKEERAVSDKIPPAKNSKITVRPDKNVLVNAAWVHEKLNNPALVIIDARPEGQYNGRDEDHNASRDGHIAGAQNIPFYSLTEEKKAHIFKSANELRKIFKDAGVTEESTLVTYCGSGIWAAPVYFAARYLGYKTYFFDGSYQEWSANEKLPITEPVKWSFF